MKLICIGVDFQHGSLETRVNALGIKDIVLSEWIPSISECVLVSTCNRVELYATGDLDPEDILNRWIQFSKISAEERKAFRVYDGLEMIEHLFRVTSSIESMVVGETQITGQVKAAYEKSSAEGKVGPLFHKIFQQSFRVSKRIRTETEVGRFPVSIPSIAVKMAEKVLGPLKNRSIAVLGLGEMGRLASEYFSTTQPRRLILYNRTESVAIDLRDKFRKEGIEALVVQDIETAIKDADVVVSAVHGKILARSDYYRWKTKIVDQVLIDLSVPPSMDELKSSDVFQFFVDDLKKVADENSLLRAQELQKANEMIKSEAAKTFRGLRILTAHDTFTQLNAKVSAIREDELLALKVRLNDINEDQWKEITKMTERLSSRILQDPVQQLRSGIEQDSSESLVQFFRNLFKI